MTLDEDGAIRYAVETFLASHHAGPHAVISRCTARWNEEGWEVRIADGVGRLLAFAQVKDSEPIVRLYT